MSSIAYTTDQEMIEYHRLCGSRNVNFWRLSSRAGFTDFKPGDLLFFYAYGQSQRKKGLVGYAHYEGSYRLSLDEMWRRYRTANGYSSKAKLKEAIEAASRKGSVPDKMNCLSLKDCVYFSSPVFPEEAGLHINDRLESFTYLDKKDEAATVRILRLAEERGIDVWAESQTYEPDSIFALDEIRQQLRLIQARMPEEDRGERELARCRRLVKKLLVSGEYEPVRGSVCDVFRVTEGRVEITVPFVSGTADRMKRIRNILGKLLLYRITADEIGLRGGSPSFAIVTEEDDEEKEFLREAVRYVGL